MILWSAMGADGSLPDDVTTLQAILRAERAARLAAEAEAQAGTLLIEKLKLTIKKLRHEQFGQSSERGALLDQFELQLADLENAAQAETAAKVAAEKIAVPSFERRKQARRPLPEQLPRERIVYPVPATCPCCGDSRLCKIGEDVTETLEFIPRQWKVIQHVREKLVCRACEAMTQPPAPLASDCARACRAQAAGPCSVCQLRPAPRFIVRAMSTSVKASISTFRRSRKGVGAYAATLMPLVEAIRSHVFAAERIHADDSVLQKHTERMIEMV
ncbi:IS66 family transposase zinc-finger binding domain-containing protein [Bradyrhizobium sp. CB2312]|uniref:IS66 family transposase zinc-finger binding domain-containing protein n=1 Tax=Bradyrhizobium sp. CB2312 TaxID=3039155 RepID=UPI0024B1CA85|nr:IS66 family transposase zinc-finger binding domain-containing protein [Bradyrhizobium sp. CB2312]WFU77154.1 IS66 family transposase zinc-finger binding domain-containing protein [Bradyrhizobium sp. CB2312]